MSLRRRRCHQHVVRPHLARDVNVGVAFATDLDVPVRFDADHMAMTIETYALHNSQQIRVIELKMPD